MGKRLILCLDGTWGRADGARHTNVVSIMRAIAPVGADGKQQVIFYDKGVGTGGRIDRLAGGLTGSGLGANVRDAYIFLGNNYEKGDEIFVFGFSRGAFTARSLVGFISSCGLLGRHSLNRLPEAWASYRARRPRRPAGTSADAWRKQQEERRRAIMAELGARDVRVACIGVWDTVGALGVPLRWFNPFAFLKRRHAFHDTGLSPIVELALHAVAIDEKRGAFGPTLWQKRKDDPLPEGQRVEQVWFAGVHSDVGGGYEDAPLAAVSLKWMVSRAEQAGLTFRTPAQVRQDQLSQRPVGGAAAVGVASTTVEPLARQHESRSPLYFVSRLLPYQRIIGGHGAWTRRFLPSRNVPAKGCEFVGQAIHASVLARWDQDILDGRRRHRYRPASVAAAKDHVPVADTRTVVAEPGLPA